jgi:hypothetical protein
MKINKQEKNKKSHRSYAEIPFETEDRRSLTHYEIRHCLWILNNFKKKSLCNLVIHHTEGKIIMLQGILTNFLHKKIMWNTPGSHLSVYGAN